MTILPLVAALLVSPARAGAGSVTSAAAVSTRTAEAEPSFKKVLVVILENTDYKEAIEQPFLKKLAGEGALLENYHAVTHPSQPNYVAMVAGDPLKAVDDERYDLKESHLGDLLEAKGLGWAAYAEGYPGGCDARHHIKRYARKHEPFISFLNVRAAKKRCARIKPASALDADAAAGRLPAFSLYIPDLDDDGHDTGVKFADAWLAKAFGPRLEDPKFMKGLLVVVTFDEDGGSKENRIYTVLLGPGVKAGARSDARYDHYSLLRTVEDRFGLGTLGRGDAKAVPITDVWRTP